jgi:hypothetical protein
MGGGELPMSIQGTLCAVGLALLAAGVLVRARLASVAASLGTVAEDGAAPHDARRVSTRSMPSWWASTVAMWSGVAFLVGAGGVLLVELWRFPPTP